MICIGFDPDLDTTGVAIVENDRITAVDIIKTKRKAKDHAGAQAMIEGVQEWFAKAPSIMAIVDRLLVEQIEIRVAIEAQEIVYTARKGANPRDLLMLAYISGAVSALALDNLQLADKRKCRLALPGAWKGQVPKQIHQNRVLTKFGFEAQHRGKDKKTGYCRPIVPQQYAGLDPEWEAMQKAFEDVHGISGWKHTVDAIGLAQWAGTWRNK